jgi:hypothetical protein
MGLDHYYETQFDRYENISQSSSNSLSTDINDKQSQQRQQDKNQICSLECILRQDILLFTPQFIDILYNGTIEGDSRYKTLLRDMIQYKSVRHISENTHKNRQQYPWRHARLECGEIHSFLFVLLLNHVTCDLCDMLDALVQYQQDVLEEKDIFLTPLILHTEQWVRRVGPQYDLGHMFDSVYSDEVFDAMETQLKSENTMFEAFQALVQCIQYGCDISSMTTETTPTRFPSSTTSSLSSSSSQSFISQYTNSSNKNINNKTLLLHCLKQYQNTESQWINDITQHSIAKQLLMDTAQRILGEQETLLRIVFRYYPTLTLSQQLDKVVMLLQNNHNLVDAIDDLVRNAVSIAVPLSSPSTLL